MSTKTRTIEEKVDGVIYYTSCNKDVISDSIGSLHGISGWFKAYISSDKFTSLNQDQKDESFEIYEGLKFLLDRLDEMNLDEPDYSAFSKKYFPAEMNA